MFCNNNKNMRMCHSVCADWSFQKQLKQKLQVSFIFILALFSQSLFVFCWFSFSTSLLPTFVALYWSLCKRFPLKFSPFFLLCDQPSPLGTYLSVFSPQMSAPFFSFLWLITHHPTFTYVHYSHK